MKHLKPFFLQKEALLDTTILSISVYEKSLLNW